MLHIPYQPSAKAAAPHSGGFTLIEVMIAVSIAAGVISVLVPTLLRQVAIGEESNRLTAVEAVVASDIDRFRNYANVWRLKVGSYPITKAYDPPSDKCNELPDSSDGLAASLLRDGQSQNPKIFKPAAQLTLGNETDLLNLTNLDEGKAVKVIGSNVLRSVDASGSKILISYRLPDNNAYGVKFSRKALVLVEAAAWCDRLP